MHVSTRGYVAAAIAVVVQGHALTAQSTNPLDLLKEAVAPGEHLSYGSGPLQFGELRVPDGPGSHPSQSSCMAVAGSPSSDNSRRRRPRRTHSNLWPLPSRSVALPPGMSSIDGSGMRGAAGRERTKTWPRLRTLSVSWHQSITSTFSAWSSSVTRPGDTWRSGSRRGISCRQKIRFIAHLHCAWQAWLISTAHRIWSRSSAWNAKSAAHQLSSSCWAERPQNSRVGTGRPQRPGCCQLGRNRNC